MANITLSMSQFFGADTAILLSVRDWYSYENGAKGAKQGAFYSVLNLADGSIVPVKVPDLVPKVSQEQLTTRNQSGNFVWVGFSDFVGTPYSREGRVQISAKASSITLLPAKEVKS